MEKTNEQCFEAICGNIAPVDVTEDDVRAQAEYWNSIGETCTEEEIQAAINYLDEI
jgi:hypothetical protein